MKKLTAKSAYFLGLISMSAGCVAVGGERPGAEVVPPAFSGVHQELQRRTEVPVVLPTWIATQGLVSTPDGPMQYLNVPLKDGQFATYPYVFEAEPERYVISLDATPDCRGASRCSFGRLEGEKLRAQTPSIAQRFAFHQNPDYRPNLRSPESQGPVQLAGGIEGIFIPFVCGASCDTSKILWETGGYRYLVGIRMASKEAVRRMANSVIENYAQGGK